MIKVAGKDVDLRKAMPLTLGDIKALKAVGVDMLAMRPGVDVPSDQVLMLLEHLIRKADSSITQEQIDASPMADLLSWSQEMQAAMPGAPPDPN